MCPGLVGGVPGAACSAEATRWWLPVLAGPTPSGGVGGWCRLTEPSHSCWEASPSLLAGLDRLTVRINGIYSSCMRSEAPPLMPIFRSQSQGRILAKLLMEPNREFTWTQLSTDLGIPLSTVQREALRLSEAELIRDRRQGRNRLVSANPEHLATAPLTALALISYGPQSVIAEEFGGADIDEVIIFGSWAARYVGEQGPPPNDIDVLVVGAMDDFALFGAAERAEARLGQTVNPIQVSVQAWCEPASSPLLLDIQARPHVSVYRPAEKA